MKHNALERISREIDESTAPGNNQQAMLSAARLDPLLSNTELLGLLQQAWQSEPQHYEAGRLIRDPDDLDYYRHRAASLLTSPDWQERNLGVKLIGLLGHEEKLPSLLHILADRTAAGRIQRLLGGDYQQVGFIRRNVLIAFQILDRWEPEVEDLVFQALEDRYYEVRAQAARTLGHFADQLIQREAVTARLRACINDRTFEVVKEAALALGAVGSDRPVVEELLSLKEHRYWQVREAALKAIAMLVGRGIIRDRRWLRQEVSRFILTTTDFRPHFLIKESYRQLFEICKKDKDDECSMTGNEEKQ